MRFRTAAILVALFAGLASADPPKLVIPAVVTPNGEYVTIKPETDAKSVMYVGLSGVDPFPSDFLKNPTHFLLSTRGLPEAVYKFAAVASSSTGEQTRVDFTVQVGANPNPPDDTRPRPKPTVDTFTKAVVAAYTAAPAEKDDAGKPLDNAKLLAGLKKVYAKGVAVADTADTWGTLFTAMEQEAKAQGCNRKLMGVQVVLAAELKKTLPSLGSAETLMTDPGRQSARAQFGRVIDALTEASK